LALANSTRRLPCGNMQYLSLAEKKGVPNHG
jgi:hypothetical protein